MKRTLTLTSPRMHGPDCSYARRLLGMELHDPVWDEDAASAARAKKWALGYPERDCVGSFGTRLEKFLLGRTKTPLTYQARARSRAKQDNVGERAVAEARRWKGTRENPANSNICKPFTTWYGWIGWGAPWCAVFVSYCLDKAGFKSVSPRDQRWAYCPTVLAHARAGLYGLKTITAGEAKLGTVLLFDWDKDGVPDHIGFATERADFHMGSIATIEGNTSSSAHGDQSNGGEVCEKIRRLSDVVAFIKVG